MWKRTRIGKLAGIALFLVALFGLLSAPPALGVCGDSAPAPAGGLLWPVSGAVTRAWSFDCIKNSGHRGIDIAAPSGSPVKSAAAGTVSFAGYTPAEGGGLTVSIDLPGGMRTTYLHLAGLLVQKGQKVEQGQTLAAATGPAIHFGIKLDDGKDAYLNPLIYLPDLVQAGDGETSAVNDPGKVAPATGNIQSGDPLLEPVAPGKQTPEAPRAVATADAPVPSQIPTGIAESTVDTKTASPRTAATGTVPLRHGIPQIAPMEPPAQGTGDSPASAGQPAGWPRQSFLAATVTIMIIGSLAAGARLSAWERGSQPIIGPDGASC